MCKETFFTFSQRFFGQACSPEFVESPHAGTRGSGLSDGGFNETLDVKNIYKNSVIKKQVHLLSMASHCCLCQEGLNDDGVFETGQFFQLIDWFIFYANSIRKFDRSHSHLMMLLTSKGDRLFVFYEQYSLYCDNLLRV